MKSIKKKKIIIYMSKKSLDDVSKSQIESINLLILISCFSLHTDFLYSRLNLLIAVEEFFSEMPKRKTDFPLVFT